MRVAVKVATPILVAALASITCGAAGEPAADATTSSSTTADVAPVSYAACDDPDEGCADADCRRVDDATNEDGAWSICVPPCTEDADCPIGAGGNVQVVCEAGRCVLECVPQVLTCPSGTRCIDPADGDAPPQCMWPVP